MKIETAKHIFETCSASDCGDCIGECVYDMDRNPQNRKDYKAVILDALVKQMPKPVEMSHCQCGEIIDGGWKYCPNCGQRLEVTK